MNKTDYAYSVAYIRAVENKLLTKADIENLITAKSPDEALQLLLDKGYGREKISPHQFETLLKEQLVFCWNEVNSVAPKGSPLNLLLYKNDFHNLKAAIKGVLTGKKDLSPYILIPDSVDVRQMVSAAANADFSDLPEPFASVGAKAYDVLTRTGDSQLADIILDKAAMDFTLKKAGETKNEFLTGYFELLNTVSDIKIAVRCAKTAKNRAFAEEALSDKSLINRDGLITAALSGFDAVADYVNQSRFPEIAAALKESMSEFERVTDNMITDYMKKSGYISLGMEPLVSYIHNKQLEVQNVRIIMSAKLHHLSEDVIRSKLREFA